MLSHYVKLENRVSSRSISGGTVIKLCGLGDPGLDSCQEQNVQTNYEAQPTSF